MMYSFVLFTTACLVSFTKSTPMKKFPRQYTGSNLDYLKSTYQGIYWDDAGSSCSDEELSILAESTRMLAPYTDIDPFHWDETPGFNRFFMNPGKAQRGQSWHDSATNQDAYLSIKSNIVQLNQFPIKGKAPWKQRNKVSYTCKEEDHLVGKCADTAGLAAYRMDSATYHNAGYGIMFCPLFFQKTYLNRLSDSPAVSLEKLGTLSSYEHLLAHELLHCKPIGVKEPVNDISDTVPGLGGVSEIYGAWKCNNWAWKFQTNGPGPVNIRTAVNDNYAWALTNNWFNRVYSWNEIVTSGAPPSTGGWHPGRKRDDSASYYPEQIDNLDPPNPETETPDDTIDASSIPDSSFLQAPNCHNASSQDVGDGDDPTVCDYVGGEYSDYLASLTNTFKSSGGCDLSNQCSNADGNAIDPSCTCTCDGDKTPLTDSRCGGFQGALPNPPAGQSTGEE